jgi:hypothetical protein
MPARWQQKQQRRLENPLRYNVPLIHGIGFNAEQVYSHYWVITQPTAPDTCRVLSPRPFFAANEDEVRTILKEYADLAEADRTERGELSCAA